MIWKGFYLTWENKRIGSDEFHCSQGLHLTSSYEWIVIGFVVKLIRKIPVQVNAVAVRATDAPTVNL